MNKFIKNLKNFLARFTSAQLEVVGTSPGVQVVEVRDNYDLIPFYKYSKNPEDYIHAKISKDDLEETFHKYVSPEVFSGDVLQKIYEDGVFVCKQLEPLKKMGINVTVDVTGGCVRDFILGKEVKDLDVMISFSNINYDYSENGLNKRLMSVSRSNLLETGFTDEDLKRVDWQYGRESAKGAKCKLVQMCFNKSELIYWEQNTEYGGLQRMEGVVKLTGSHYPIDLLVTDLIKPEFVGEFDFNICKASLCFINRVYKKDVPSSAPELISRFVADQSFFEDIYNKTITLDTSNKSESYILSSITKHLPRVEAKYPDYKVVVTEGNPKMADVANMLIEKQSLSSGIANAKAAVKFKL